MFGFETSLRLGWSERLRRVVIPGQVNVMVVDWEFVENNAVLHNICVSTVLSLFGKLL